MAKRRANGEGNIRKRKDGRWEGRWEGRYTAGYDSGQAHYKKRSWQNPGRGQGKAESGYC